MLYDSKMCEKAVNRYFFVFDSIPDQYRTQEMCDTVVYEDPSLIIYCCPDKYKTKRMFDSIVSEDPSLIVYCLDKYETQGICDEAVNDSLSALKLVLDWFVTNKMIKGLFTALYTDENIHLLMKILVISYLIVMEWIFLI